MKTQGFLMFAALFVAFVALILVLKRRGMDDRRVVAWGLAFFMLGSAPLCGLIGRWLYNDLQVLEKRGVVTSAHVDDYSTGKKSHVDVTFTTKIGQRVNADTANFSVDDIHDDRIDIVYDPEKPTRMQSAAYGFDPFSPVMVWSLGGLLVLGSAASAFSAWRQGRRVADQVRPVPSPS